MCGCKVKKKKWASHVRCIKRRMGVDKGGSDGNGDGVVTREWRAEKGHKATPDYSQSVLIALK